MRRSPFLEIENFSAWELLIFVENSIEVNLFFFHVNYPAVVVLVRSSHSLEQSFSAFFKEL
jgi:hypothetical protein